MMLLRIHHPTSQIQCHTVLVVLQSLWVTINVYTLLTKVLSWRFWYLRKSYQCNDNLEEWKDKNYLVSHCSARSSSLIRINSAYALSDRSDRILSKSSRIVSVST